MKKFLKPILLILLCVGIAQAQYNFPRFGTTSNADNTGRFLTYGLQKFTFYTGVDTIKISSNKFEMIVAPDSLIDSLIVQFKDVKNSFLGDKVYFLATAKGASRKVKFAPTNLSSGTTLTCLQNKRVTIVFIFNGVRWVEVASYVES